MAQSRNGITLISPDDWDAYQLPALTVLRPHLVKFQMYYGDGIASPVFDGGHIDQVVALGAAVVIFRTSEHRISDHDVDQQLGPLAPLIQRYRQQGSPVEFWLEVGNEPDLTGLDPWVTRWHLLFSATRSHPNWPTVGREGTASRSGGTTTGCPSVGATPTPHGEWRNSIIPVATTG